MAWRSLYLWFQTFRKSYHPDVNAIYKNYLYDEWFNSLSEDEQNEEIKRQKRLKEQREKQGQTALMQLAYMTSMAKRLSGRNLDEPISYTDMLNSFMI